MPLRRQGAPILKRVLFRADSGPHVGLGHITRCLSLSAAAKREGVESIFLTSSDQAVRNRIISSGPRVEIGPISGDNTDLRQCLTTASRNLCDAIVVDSYSADSGYLEKLRAAGFYVVAIDDFARYSFPCHLVINGGAHARLLSYRSSSGDTRFLLGPEYALLSPQFWDARSRKIRKMVENILVTLGGGDTNNLMPKLLSSLDSLPCDFRITTIIGPFFDNKDEIKRTAESCRHEIRMVEEPETLRDIMVESDLAVASGGQTQYELAAIGTPTLALELADNQAQSLRALEALGVIHVVGKATDERLMDGLKASVKDLIKNSRDRIKMSAVGQHLVDPRGAIRAAEEMLCSFPRNSHG